MVRRGQPDHGGARRRVDVRRGHPGGAAADDAAAGDDRGRRALRLPRRHVGSAVPHQPLPRGHHLRHRRGRPAGRRRGARDPRPGQRCDARRVCVRRERPPPAGVGARRRDPELPARPSAVRRPPPRPGGLRRVRRTGGRRGAQARRHGPADHRGRAPRRRRALPSRAAGDRPRARRGRVPDQGARAASRRTPGVPRPGGGGDRADADVDPRAARAADAPRRPRPGRARARPGRHAHGPLGDRRRPGACRPAPCAAAAAAGISAAAG